MTTVQTDSGIRVVWNQMDKEVRQSVANPICTTTNYEDICYIKYLLCSVARKITEVVLSMMPNINWIQQVLQFINQGQICQINS